MHRMGCRGTPFYAFNLYFRGNYLFMFDCIEKRSAER